MRRARPFSRSLVSQQSNRLEESAPYQAPLINREQSSYIYVCVYVKQFALFFLERERKLSDDLVYSSEMK